MNSVEGDGCGRDCKTEHPEVCPGAAIHLEFGTMNQVTVSGNTNGATDKFVSSPNGIPNSNCGNGGWKGPDWIYQVIPQADGNLQVSLNPSYGGGYVRVRTSCSATLNDEVACRWVNSGTASTSVVVKKDTPYYVAADSWNNSSGPFSMTLTLQ